MKVNSNIIDGKSFAKEILAKLTNKVGLIKKEYNITPTLAIVLVGDNPASNIYVRNKLKAAASVDINAFKITLSANIESRELLAEIDKLNKDPIISGIIVQLPLPPHIDKNSILHAIFPEKDVDGFHPLNVGLLHSWTGDGFAPCTALGCLELIKRYEPDLLGKNVVVIGRSNIVGKPLSALLLRENCTVTMCHSKTENLKQITYAADIVVSATGSPHFLTADYFNPHSIVIDVGINRLTGNDNIVGDVDFQNVHNKVRYITPVPGGVGPVTVAFLLTNTFKAMLKQHGINIPYE